MIGHRTLPVWIALALLVGTTTWARAGYQITDLGVISQSGGTSQAAAINLSGAITGSSDTGSGAAHAFVYDPSTRKMIDLAGPTSPSTSIGLSINISGEVVGVTTTPAGVSSAFESTGSGQFKTFTPLTGWTGSQATGVNDKGVIVGYATLGQGVTHGFVAKPGGGTADLGTLGGLSSQANGINFNGQIVGTIETAPGVYHAFRTTLGGAVQDLGGLGGPGTSSFGTAINSAGEVVGFGGVSGNLHAFRTGPDGTLQDLGTLSGAINAYANAVNTYGQIVGTATYASGASAAFYYSDQTQLVPLSQMIDNGQGWDIQTATGINDYGQIVGSGVFNGVTHAYLLTPTLTPVPEPSSLALLGLGLLGLVTVAIRRGRTGGQASGGPAGASPAR